MVNLERQLSELGKRLHPRSTWVEGVRQTLRARGHARRSYMGVGRFVLHMPFMFPRVSSTMGAALMLVMGLTVSVSAAKESLPGNRLYSLKRTMEKVELKTASSTEKPQLQISQATRRLEEAGVLAVKAPNSPKIKESLDEFRTQITALQANDQAATPAERQAIAQTIVNTAPTYARVLNATQVVVAPPLAREARQAKHIVNLSTVRAVETLVQGTVADANGVVALDPLLEASIKDQVAAIKVDAKEASDLVQSGSMKKIDPLDATAKVRVDLAAKANETIGTAEYLIAKGDYIQATAKVRQTLEFMVKLDEQSAIAAKAIEPVPAIVAPEPEVKSGGIQLEVVPQPAVVDPAK